MRVFRWDIRARQVFGALCLGAAIYGVVKTIMGVGRGELIYPEILALWFAIWLAAFHAYFAFDKHLTETKAKAIDYIYLGTAAVGVFFFALAYEDQREASKAALRNMASTTVQEKYEAFHESLVAFVQATCAPVPATLAVCHPARAVLEALTRKQDLNEVEALDDLLRGLRSIREEGRASETRKAAERLEQAFSEFIGLHLLMKPLEPSRLDDRLRGLPDIVRSALKAALIFGQIAVWPFMLAFAFALRITKVTIEILGWPVKSTSTFAAR